MVDTLLTSALEGKLYEGLAQRGRIANLCLERAKVEAFGRKRISTKTRSYYISDSVERFMLESGVSLHLANAAALCESPPVIDGDSLCIPGGFPCIMEKGEIERLRGMADDTTVRMATWDGESEEAREARGDTDPASDFEE
eukprot:2380748-Amphidinium_carterae.1